MTIMREWLTTSGDSCWLHKRGWGAGAALIFWLSVVAVSAAETSSSRSTETSKGSSDAQPEPPSAGRGKPEKVEKDGANQIKERAVKQRLQKVPTPDGPTPIPYPNISGKESVR